MKVLILGAGKSATSLIHHLSSLSGRLLEKVSVGDINLNAALAAVSGHNADGLLFDIQQESAGEIISRYDLVISMLPAFMHPLVAAHCLRHKKHLFTASYISPELKAMEEDIHRSGLLFLNECGLDPGLDHMSAMEIIDREKHSGGKIISFRSYCGGLVAPESNDNPWGYKFSWNPRNVILAGQGTARYRSGWREVYLPYHRLFAEADIVEVEGYGSFEGYFNRDSLSYIPVYGLYDSEELIRGTLRAAPYCRAWNVFVQLGLTDDSYELDVKGRTYAEFLSSFLPHKYSGTLEDKMKKFSLELAGEEVYRMIAWTGIMSDELIGLEKATPAKVLQKLLESKWVLKPGDKDMVVMHHYFEVRKGSTLEQITSTLVVKGNDEHTAMAQTVGLPLAYATELLAGGMLNRRGLVIPVNEDLYKPILQKMSDAGMRFIEKRKMLA